MGMLALPTIYGPKEDYQNGHVNLKGGRFILAYFKKFVTIRAEP